MTDKTRRTTFADAVAELEAKGIEVPKSVRVAAGQRWTVADGTKAQLEADLAGVGDPHPTFAEAAAELDAQNPHADAAVIAAEAKRLSGNAKVNVWRKRARLQATIDLRSAKAKAVRAKGSQKAAPASAVHVTFAPDLADQAEAADSAADVA